MALYQQRGDALPRKEKRAGKTYQAPPHDQYGRLFLYLRCIHSSGPFSLKLFWLSFIVVPGL
jgi:hypothetical protein